MVIGKHTEIGQHIAELEETIRKRDREIYEVKQECANAFKQIFDLSKSNGYGETRIIMNKMGEIAKDNFNLLLDDLIDYKYDQNNKIIELPTRQSK